MVKSARRCETIQEQFERFDRENPFVYRRFVQMAWNLKNVGRTRYSADAILHTIRFLTDIETTGDEFKINNNFSAMYARKLMAEEPAFEGFFETRVTRQEKQIAVAQSAGRLF